MSTLHIQSLLMDAVRKEASDLHLVTGYVPTCRIHGALTPLEVPVVQAAWLAEQLPLLCRPGEWKQFEQKGDVDFSVELPSSEGNQRFRANYFRNNGQPGACFRIIPNQIPDFEWAGFPLGLAHRLTAFRNGLVLVTGVAGSGKSTSLAMVINLLNEHGGHRIITIEQPVEYVFPAYARSIVTQREVGRDVVTFSDGLKYGLRQDPDILLVGEIRDRETARMAMSAAETGHLIFASLHTRDAKGAISRMVDLFPQDIQTEIRTQLAMSLRAVISQHLLTSATPQSKRSLALEVLFNNLPVSSAIRSGRLESIDNCLITGKSEGMITLDESLRVLYKSGQISLQTARRFGSESARFE